MEMIVLSIPVTLMVLAIIPKIPYVATQTLNAMIRAIVQLTIVEDINAIT